MHDYPALFPCETELRSDREPEREQERLYRQMAPSGHWPPQKLWLDFRPHPDRDNGCLSVSRSSILTDYGSYLLRREVLNRRTGGSRGVSLKTLEELDLRVVDDFGCDTSEGRPPLGHAYIDFRSLNLNHLRDEDTPNPGVLPEKQQRELVAMRLYYSSSLDYPEPEE
jgi:hypothetical protein